MEFREKSVKDSILKPTQWNRPKWWTKWNINDEFQDRIFRKNFWAEVKMESTVYFPFIWFWLRKGELVSDWLKVRKRVASEELICSLMQLHSKLRKRSRETIVWGKCWLHSESKFIQQLAVWHESMETNKSKGCVRFLDIPAKRYPKQPQAICFTQRENSIYYTINHRLNTLAMAVITQRTQDEIKTWEHRT